MNGYEADFASDGEQGIKLLEGGRRYDLALVDFLMARMHGVDFVRQAKSRGVDLPIIAMSAFDDVENAFLEAGARVFLAKPFDPFRLEKEIDSIVTESR